MKKPSLPATTTYIVELLDYTVLQYILVVYIGRRGWHRHKSTTVFPTRSPLFAGRPRMTDHMVS